MATVLNAEIVNQHVNASLQGVVLSGQADRNAIRDFRVREIFRDANNNAYLRVKYFDESMDIQVDELGYTLVEALMSEL